MSTKAGTLGPNQGHVFGNREWTIILLVAAVAIAALVMSVVALQSNPSTTTHTGVAPHAAARAATDIGVYERSQPVTGTGPGLAFVGEQAGLRGIYERSAPITGTGPDLVRVADASANERIYRNSHGVTGTGPGLEHLGK